MRSSLIAAIALLGAAASSAGCSVGVPGVGDGSITCNNDHDCQPNEFCDTADSPHYCFALPPDGGDAGADAGDGGGLPDAGDAGAPDGGTDAGCRIAGQAYAPGALEPGFACVKCDPAKSTSDWSSSIDGTACGNDAGTYCFNGACVPSCLIDAGLGGALVFAGATPPGNGCQVCDPDAGATGYTNLPELAACADDGGNFCHAGVCGFGCGIDGGFVASWTPMDQVVSGCCNPGVSTASWTPAFAAAREVVLTAHPSGLTVNDFNGDALSDFAVTEFDNTVDVYLVQIDGGFGAQLPVDFSPGPSAIVSATFTVSGKADIALLEESAPALQLLYGNGDGTFEDGGTVALTLLSGLNGILAAPVTSAVPDILLTGSLSGAPGVDLFANQSGRFSGGHSDFSFTQGSSPWALALGGFRFDAGSDVALLNSDQSGVDILVNNGGTLKEAQLLPTVGLPQAIASMELNNDGLADLVVVSTQPGDAGMVQAYLSLGDGGFAVGSRALIDPKPVAVTPFVRTGPVSALAVADGKNGSVNLFTAIDGGLLPAGAYSAGSSANAIATGDFNGDGLTDLAVSDPNSSVYILYGQCR